MCCGELHRICLLLLLVATFPALWVANGVVLVVRIVEGDLRVDDGSGGGGCASSDDQVFLLSIFQFIFAGLGFSLSVCFLLSVARGIRRRKRDAVHALTQVSSLLQVV